MQIMVSLGKLLAFILLIVHWLSCAYFSIAYLDGFAEGEGSFTPPIELASADVPQQYFIAFAWGMRAVTDVGGESL